jgi:hypothetical protein
MLPPDHEQIGAATAEICAVHASRAGIKLFNYEEALNVEALVDKLIRLAKIADLGSHPYVLEDGRELLKVPRPHTQVGGTVLEGMYTDVCTSIEESRISGRPGRTRCQVSAAGVRSGPAGIVSKDPRIVPS